MDKNAILVKADCNIHYLLHNRACTVKICHHRSKEAYLLDGAPLTPLFMMGKYFTFADTTFCIQEINEGSALK